jgi:hypothetical protein
MTKKIGFRCQVSGVSVAGYRVRVDGCGILAGWKAWRLESWKASKKVDKGRKAKG